MEKNESRTNSEISTVMPKFNEKSTFFDTMLYFELNALIKMCFFDSVAPLPITELC